MALIQRVWGRRDFETHVGAKFDLFPQNDPRPWQVFLSLEEEQDGDNYVSEPVSRVARFKTEVEAQDAAYKLHRAIELAPLPGRLHHSEAVFRVWVEVKLEGSEWSEDSLFAASWYGRQFHAQSAYRESFLLATTMFP
ncbi:MAG TPA: hypothetical protein EYF98_14095 [Planctomycetes bacterium]|nr:hypothetical protein [Planctomycetota bacterium]